MTSATAPARSGASGGVVAAVSLVTLLAAVAVVQCVGIGGSPQRGLDEGVAVASAGHLRDAGWAAGLRDGGGPTEAPALWQLAGLARASAGVGVDALASAPSVVEGGRWLVAPLAVLSAGLLWVLVRRAGLGPGTAAVAVLVGGLSPAAVALHRVVSAEAMALPWALAGAALLVTSPPATVAGAHPSGVTAPIGGSRAAGRPAGRPAGARGRSAAVVAGSALLALGAATSPLTLLLLPLVLVGRLGRLAARPAGAGGHAVSAAHGSALHGREATVRHGRGGRHHARPARGPARGRARGQAGGGARAGASPGRLALGAGCCLLVGAGAVVGLRAAGSLDAALSAGPPGSGGLATSTSGAGALVTWAELDVVTPALAVLLALVAVRAAAWRAHALVTVLPVVAVLVLDLPAVSTTVLLVPAAVLVAAATSRVLALGGRALPAFREPHPHAPLRSPARARAVAAAPGACAVALALAVGAVWAAQGRATAARSPDRPVAEATAWLADAGGAGSGGVVADTSVIVDLARSGVPGLTALGPDGRVELAGAAAGGAAWLVETAAVRAAAERDALTGQVVAASRVVRTFGRGPGRVELLAMAGAEVRTGRRPEAGAGADGTSGGAAPPPQDGPAGGAPPGPRGEEPSAPPLPPDTPGVADPRAAEALAQNPRITFSERAAGVLAAEPVDTRLLALLAVLAAEHDLSVTDIPLVEGQRPGELRRTALVDAVDGRSLSTEPSAADDVVADLEAQDPRFRPRLEASTVTGDGPARRQLVVQLPPPR